jgi:hypothetical protein
MKKPIAFNNSTGTDFGIKLGDKLEVGTSAVDFGAGAASEALNWFNSLAPTNQYVIVSDTFNVLDVNGSSYTIDDNNVGRPVMWCTGDKTDVNLLNTVNRLPGRRGEVAFTGATDAIQWVNNSGTYYFLSFGDVGKSFAAVVQVDGSSNYHHLILNYDETTAELIDTGINYNDFYQDDILPLNDKGYMSIFHDNSDIYRIQFIGNNGSMIEDYTSTNPIDYRNWDAYDGAWAVFIDRTNGIVKLFDGINAPVVITYDTGFESYDFDWNWDAVTSNNDLVYYIQNSNTNERTYYILKGDGTITASIKTSNYSDYDVQFCNAYSSNFFTELTYSNIDNKYTLYRVLDNNGTVLGSTDLTGLPNDYNDYDFDFIGSGVARLMLYSSDNDVPYYFIKYDETIDSYDVLSHTRGTNFTNRYGITKSNFSVDGYKHELGCQILHSNDYDDSGYYYYYYTYLDIVTFIKGYGPMNVVNFASNQTTGSYTNGMRFYNWYNGGGIFFQTKVEGACKILTIKDDNTIQYTTLNANASLIDDAWTNRFGDKWFIAPFLSSDFENGTLLSLPAYLISKDGTILDSHTFTGDTNSISLSSWNSYNTLYVKDNQHSGQAVYVNENNTFTAIDDYGGIYNASRNYMGRPTYNTGSGIALVNSGTGTFKCINATGVSNEFSFPGDYDTGYGIDTGKDYFSFNYGTNSGTVGFNIYDYSGNTIQTLTTTDTNTDEYDVVENRAFISTNNGSTKNLHLFTATGQQSVAYTVEYDNTVNDVEYYWC